MVHGILKGVPVPFPLPDDNACHFMSCPISADTTIVYSAPFECEESYPEVRLNKKKHLCITPPYLNLQAKPRILFRFSEKNIERRNFFQNA